MGPIVALFNFTIRQTLLDRKIWLSVLLLAAPCALVLVIRNVAPPIDRPRELWEMYHVLAQFFMLMVLVPLVCMVHGTALIGADVEARTIAYLITRRMRKATVLLVKFAATVLVLAVLCDLAMIGLHLCALAGRDVPSLVAHSDFADWNPTSDLCCYLLIIPLGVLSFLAVFSLIGLLTNRPLAFSVTYLVAFELILSNIPVRAKMYSLSCQLRVPLAGAMPRVVDLYELPPELCAKLFPPGATVSPALCGAIVMALILSCVLITLRELMPTKVSRE